MKLCGPSARLTIHKHSHTPVTAHAALTNPYLLCVVQLILCTCFHTPSEIQTQDIHLLDIQDIQCVRVCVVQPKTYLYIRTHQLHITFIPDITFWHVLGICAAQSDRKSVEVFANREQVSTSGESNAYHTHYFQHCRYRLVYILYSCTKPAVACLWLPSDIAVDPLLSIPRLVTVAYLDKLYRISHRYKLEISVNCMIFSKMCSESDINFGIILIISKIVWLCNNVILMYLCEVSYAAFIWMHKHKYC